MRARLLVALRPSLTACYLSEVAMHLHCAHTHRMLQAMCTQCATKRGGFKTLLVALLHRFRKGVRVIFRWEKLEHDLPLVISISTISGEGRSPLYISTTSRMLVCDPSAQRTGGTRPRRDAAFTARGENWLSKELTKWSKMGPHNSAGNTVLKFPPGCYSYAVALCLA